MHTSSPATTAHSGLTRAEAAARLARDGPNELPSTGQRQLGRIALDVLREPMFLLLVSAAAIYLLLGDFSDALMLLGFVLLVMGITVSQEYKTERVLEALRDLTSPRAQVIREGVVQRIAGREVVRDDILLLAEGDRVAADAILLACTNFAVDESLLTGESVAVRKLAASGGQLAENNTLQQPGGDDLPYIYSGTLAVQGNGIARVVATGLHSEIGKIGKALHAVETESSPLQREIGWIVRWLAIIGSAVCLLLFLIYGLLRGDWLHGLLTGITLAMSILPEEYPMVLTVFLAMGAWRISRHQILTRRMPAVETLGATSVLCVDKTGTLTLNRMQVQQLSAGGAIFKVEPHNATLPENFHELLEFAVLASAVDPYDPMETAIHELAQHFLGNTEHLHRDWQHKHDYALSPELLALSHVWKARDRDEYVVASKGAPEAVADLCHFDAVQLAALEVQINRLATQGMRVLGVARATYRGREWPDIQHDFEFEFIGLIGLADPVRPTVRGALDECASAGIRVVMITGDYPATAAAIAQQIGLDTGTGGIISGPELNGMDDSTLRQRIRHSNIFARMVPQQKLRLVNALKANGEVVTMTGDGVNDAPALKAAHIGIAMGGRGTDVAREAAALVLVDDDFASIVKAVRLGRGIYDNMRKALAYVFAVHIPIIGLSLLPVLLGWPVIFAPVHIVFLEMIINPACSIAFEAEAAESNIMQRPPRNAQEHLFSRPVLLISLAQGTAVLLGSMLIMYYMLQQGASENTVRAMTFCTIVFGNLGLILSNRSWNQSLLSTLGKQNKAVWWIVTGAGSFLIMSISVPFMRDIFHFSTLSYGQLGLCCCAGLSAAILFEMYKGIKKFGEKSRANP